MDIYLRFAEFVCLFRPKKFKVSKKGWVLKMGEGKMLEQILSPKIWLKEKFESKKIKVKIILGPKNFGKQILCPKKFSVLKMLCSKNVVSKNFMIQEPFGPKN